MAVAFPAAGLVAYVLAGAAAEARSAAYAQVQYFSTASASRLDLLIRDNVAVLESAAQRTRVGKRDPRDCDPLFQELVSTRTYYVSYVLRDPQANVVCASRADPLGAEVIAAMPWFAAGIASDRPTISNAYFYPKTGRWVVVLTHPLADDSGNPQGLLTLSLDLGILQERLFDAFPENSLVSVLDRHDVFLMRSVDPATWIGKPLPGPQAGRLASRREGETFETTGVDGVARMYAFAVVPSSGWRVFAALPRDVVFASQRERLVRSAGIGAVLLTAIVALSYGIGLAIARPIGELARAANAIRRGERLPFDVMHGAPEVTDVATELNRLVNERERRSGERVAIVAHYDRILKSARDIYLLVDDSGRIADFNDAALEAYGYRPDELRGKNLVDLRAPDERESFQRDWKEAGKPGGWLFETVHQRHDGSRFNVEVSSTLIDIAGTTYRQSLVRDITARKAADELLRQQNEELERFNRAVVGREMTVIELKERINALSRELGREPPFPMRYLDAGSEDRGVAPGP